MKTTHCSFALLPAGLLALAVLPSSAPDWPQWRGPGRDAKATFTAPKTWPKELAQTWKVTVGDGVATPALVGDKLYVFARQAGSEILRCLDAANGKELWAEKYEALGASGPASGFSGPRCSPTVANGKLVTLGVRGGGMGGGMGYGSIVDAGSVLLALTPASQLVAFAPGEKAFTELARIKVSGSPTYAYPVVSGKRIFIKDQDSVTRYTVE